MSDWRKCYVCCETDLAVLVSRPIIIISVAILLDNDVSRRIILGGEFSALVCDRPYRNHFHYPIFLSIKYDHIQLLTSAHFNLTT